VWFGGNRKGGQQQSLWQAIIDAVSKGEVFENNFKTSLIVIRNKYSENQVFLSVE